MIPSASFLDGHRTTRGARLKVMTELDIANRHSPQDGHTTVRIGSHKIDIRLSVIPTVYGERVSRHHIVRYLAALVLTSMLLVPFGIGGVAYLVVALGLGGLFFAVGAWGLKRNAGDRWARGLFITSMIYLTGLFVALSIVG